MSKIAEQAALNAINGFHTDIATAKKRHPTLIAELEAELLAVSYELSDSFMEFADELSADLGAKAANECDAKADQDQAIRQCASYVSNDVSSHAMALVSACIAFHGPDEGSSFINKMVSESPVRADVEMGR